MMRLLTLPSPRIHAYAPAAECRSCQFATTTTTGRTVCRSLHMDVRPDWACVDYRPGGRTTGAAVPEPEEDYAYA